jgi:hypothetical protein
VFNDLIRLEIELWNAIGARLKSGGDRSWAVGGTPGASADVHCHLEVTSMVITSVEYCMLVTAHTGPSFPTGVRRRQP